MITMQTNEDDLILNFENDLINAEVRDLTATMLDTGIDLISQNEVVCSIPIVGILADMYNIGKNFMAGCLAKKILKLLFNTRDVSPKDKEKFIKEYGVANKEKGAEALLDVLERLDNINKVDILSNLLISQIKEDVTIEEFISLTSALEKLPFTQINRLLDYKNDTYIPGESELINATGLLYVSSITPTNPNEYKLSRYGWLLLKHGCKKDVEIPIEYKTKNSAYGVIG